MIVQQELIPLFEFLREKGVATSATGIKAIIKRARVTVNGVAVLRGDILLKKGQDVVVHARGQINPEAVGSVNQLGLKPIFEDEYLVAFEKPPHTICISGHKTGGKDFFTLSKYYMATRATNPSPIYWIYGLDKEVSGIMIFAKSAEIQEKMKKSWLMGRKRYVCLVQNELKGDTGVMENELDDRSKIKKSTYKDRNSLPITKYKVLKRYGGVHSLLEIEPLKEKKLQIRFHLSEAGCPIVGDGHYGAQGNPLKRLALHFNHATFQHPILRTETKITLPVPKEFTLFGKKTQPKPTK